MCVCKGGLSASKWKDQFSIHQIYKEKFRPQGKICNLKLHIIEEFNYIHFTLRFSFQGSFLLKLTPTLWSVYYSKKQTNYKQNFKRERWEIG